jgi:DNA-binding transcriptional regulator YbjK
MRVPERRGLLADAAIEVLARDGSRGLTHRAVDREAEVPEGTAKNYFPTREALLEAVAWRMSTQHRVAVERLRELTPERVTPAEIIALYRAMLLRATGIGRTQFLALFELYLEGVRRPTLRGAVGEMAKVNVEAAMSLHRAAGLSPSVRAAGLLDAFFLGLAVTVLALPEEALDAVGLADFDSLGAALINASCGEYEIAS